MAETDVFERRLRAALVRHTDGGPSHFDALGFARAVAAREPRRRGLGAVLGWRAAGVPQTAWALLLVGLLAALAVGTLAVGSQLQRNAPAVLPPVGQVYVCPPGSNPDEPGPVGQARPTTPSDEWPSLAFDRRAGKLVRAGRYDFAQTWTFDVCTNTWARMHPDREPEILPGRLVYDVDSDLTIGVKDGTDGARSKVRAYDLGANTWTEKGPTPPFVDEIGLLFYDPVSGHVVAGADDDDDNTLGGELWSYEVETDTWTPIPQAEPLVIGPHNEFLAYDPAVDRLVAYTSAWRPAGDAGDLGRDVEAETWLFNLRTGTWSGTSAVTPPVFSAGVYGQVPAIAYDEAAQRTVLLGQGHAAAYDATSDNWETLYEGSTTDECGPRPECRQMPFMVYDPVNERLVVYRGSISTDNDPFADWVSPDDVLAFDTRTREWTVLLEASPVETRAPQPATTSVVTP